jgi:hypothetical protein
MAHHAWQPYSDSSRPQQQPWHNPSKRLALGTPGFQVNRVWLARASPIAAGTGSTVLPDISSMISSRRYCHVPLTVQLGPFQSRLLTLRNYHIVQPITLTLPSVHRVVCFPSRMHPSHWCQRSL